MGVSTDAVLVYGYDLGSADDGWKVQQTGEYGALVIDWYDEENEDDELPDFTDAAVTRMLHAAGFTETDWRADGYYARRRAAEEALGVKIETYCSGESPMYLLAANSVTVARGWIKTLDPEAMQREPAERGWDDKLRMALDALGLTPEQEEPQWLLCSYWG